MKFRTLEEAFSQRQIKKLNNCKQMMLESLYGRELTEALLEKIDQSHLYDHAMGGDRYDPKILKDIESDEFFERIANIQSPLYGFTTVQEYEKAANELNDVSKINDKNIIKVSFPEHWDAKRKAEYKKRLINSALCEFMRYKDKTILLDSTLDLKNAYSQPISIIIRRPAENLLDNPDANYNSNDYADILILNRYGEVNTMFAIPIDCVDTYISRICAGSDYRLNGVTASKQFDKDTNIYFTQQQGETKDDAIKRIQTDREIRAVYPRAIRQNKEIDAKRAEEEAERAEQERIDAEKQRKIDK